MAQSSQDGEAPRRTSRAAGLVHGVDLVVAVVLLAFCAYAYYLTTRFEEVPAVFTQDIPPEYVPRLLLWTIIALSLCLPFEHLFKPGGRAHFAEARSANIRLMAYLTGGLLVVLVALVPVTGTYAGVFLVCLLLPVLWGERRWKILLPYAVVFPTVVMLLFSKVLGVYFHPGLLGIDLR